MAKSFVIASRKQNDNYVIDTETTTGKLLDHFQVLVEEVSASTGKREAEVQVKDGQKVMQTLAETPIVIDPESKKKFKAHIQFLLSAFMANRQGANVGRSVSVDLDAMQRIYVETLKKNPNKKRGVLNMLAAVKYNETYGGDSEIDANYVARQVKEHGWDAVAAQVNEPETVSS